MSPTFRTSTGASAADPGKPHLILVGLPGAGKSVVGAGVAERLARTFLDFDTEIERREGKTISQIFGERGEPYFRGLERAITDELRLFGNMVLAPGGGWVTQPESIAMLRPPSILVYLKVRPETALKRLGTQRFSRPLLMRPDPAGELKRLLASRVTAFESADHVIDTELLDVQRVIEKIVQLATTM